MDQEQERIQADLRGLLDGEVRCDDIFNRMYASDGSIFEIKPLGVVRPRHTRDVAVCVQYAAENGIPLHPRGAGTGLAGEALGPGLVIDFSHSMRRIISVGEETVRVQAGAALGQLNRHLAPRGRMYGPDPSHRQVKTVGGAIGVDAADSFWPRYGSARRCVESLQVVLSDGSVIEAAAHAAFDPATDTDPRRRELVQRLAELIRNNRLVIDDHQPRTPVDRCGYQLHDVLLDGRLHLGRLFTGAEGTLGLVTEATLRTDPLPAHRGVVLLLFDRLESAARAAIEAPRFGAAACDLVDRRSIIIARETDVRYDLLLPERAEALLLVEQQGSDPAEVRERLTEMIDVLGRKRQLAFDSQLALDPDQVDFFWQLVHHVAPALYRLKGSRRPLPFIEDVAVPPAMLPEFLIHVQNVLKRHHVTASLFAHAGHGVLHVRPFLDLADPSQSAIILPLAEDLYQAVIDAGGTISSEHGVGLSRSWFVPRQVGALYEVFREVKRIADPARILNPGKIVDAPPPESLTQWLRPVVLQSAALDESHLAPPPAGVAASAPTVHIQLPTLLEWTAEELAQSAQQCNGCGYCRTQAIDERMCPIFRYSLAEEASPRSKANLVRALITGELSADELTQDTLKALADLCVHCHQCRLECPARVDIPKLMAECKGQYVATNGLRLGDWIFTRLDLVSKYASLIAPAANWAIGNRQMRWLMERMTGIARGRKLPRVAARSFLRLAHRRRLTRPTRRSGRKVLFFLDIYANWYDIQLAESLVAVMEHHGIAVYVHPQQRQSGMAMVAAGALETARRLASRNVAILADAVRQGYDIVTTEPSAALCLVHEYPNLIDDDDARLVAAHTYESSTYLWRLHQSGQLALNFRPIHYTLGYHLPCHLKALGVGSPGENLLRLIPGIRVCRLEAGCSGMAGAYGMKRQNFRSSLRAGWGLISSLRDSAISAGATECSSCKMQMEQGATKPTIHPLKVLALAYGLKPEIAGRITAPPRELVVS